ncbi:MAG: peptide chain release factor N(5)-glutamine methyltransferase [Verrucomicrobiota bacterium]
MAPVSMVTAVTVLEIIQRSTEFLANKGVESPRLQIELLLAHVLRMPRLQLYLNFERAISEAELQTLREFVKRRALREPLQHILGSTSFCGLEIEVNSHVLVPRPETELLAEQANRLLDSVVPRENDPPAALDFGTGSGCLAIAMATHCPRSRIVAIDLSTHALDVARRNAVLNRVENQIEFVLSNGFQSLPLDRRFDLIVSNPPYIPSAEIETLAPEVRNHDPRLALDGGVDGLNFYRLLAEQAGRFLRPEGNLLVEFGDEQADHISHLLERHGWLVRAVIADLTGRSRIIIAQRNES